VTLSRRSFVVGAALLPWTVEACTPSPPATPLAYLYGKNWVHGAYAHYARGYAQVQQSAEDQSFAAYRLFAQKGVSALASLQEHGVPFYVRVSPSGDGFAVERNVPERLTFTADMTAADRDRATREWQRAREHIQTDYIEIARLNHALGVLLSQLQHVRSAADRGRVEQFKLCRQLDTIDQGGALPFPLPYQVTRQDYRSVLLLLLEGLQSDRQRLHRVESEMIAVGLTARATDANSASLATNLDKVLLAIVRDAAAAPPARSAEFPERDERGALLARASKLRANIVKSEAYRQWLEAQKESEDPIGQILNVLDQVTGLETSVIYRKVLRIWRGDGDYLDYLKLAVSLVPTRTGLSGVLDDAVRTTDRCRHLVGDVERARAILTEAKADAASGMLELQGQGLVNVATERARGEIAKQLVYFKDRDEQQAVQTALGQTSLVTGTSASLR
jgi:hypothetical protein